MGPSWHTSEPLPTAHAGHDQFVGGDHPARASAAFRELIKAREIATEDHLAEIEKREDR